MGANNSTRAELEKQRNEIEADKKKLRELLKQVHRTHLAEAEKQRLHQQTVNEHHAALRLQEEQRYKEAAEKWRREKQQKEAYTALQRKVEQLKIQQEIQTKQKIFQENQENVSIMPTTSSMSLTLRETNSVQQKVSTIFQNNKIPNDTSSSVFPITKPTQSSDSQSGLSKNFLGLEQQKNASTSIKSSQSAISLNDDSEKIEIPESREKSSQAKSLEKFLTETSKIRKIASDVIYDEWSIVNYVVEENSISKITAENIIALLDDNYTLPFIARYRKNMTQGMEMNDLRKVKNSYVFAKLIKNLALFMTKEAKKNNIWTPEFRAFVNSSKSIEDLNYIYSIFNYSRAKDFGLKNIVEAVIKGKSIAPLTSFVNPDVEGLVNEEQVKNRIISDIAHAMIKNKSVFDIIEKIKSKYPIKIETNLINPHFIEEAIRNRESNNENYAKYENFVSYENNLKRDEIFDINRGEAKNILKVNIIISQSFADSFRDRLLNIFEKSVKSSQLHKQLITEAINYTYNNWIKKFIIKSTRDAMTKRAEDNTMEMIIKIIRESFFALPVRGKNVIGISSVSQLICMIAAVSDKGNLLACETIDLQNTNNPRVIRDAETTLVNMVHKYKCTIFAVSNDKMMIKMVHFIEGLIKKKAFGEVEITYGIVDDAGLSIDDINPIASLEFSRFDKNVIGAVSIARRLQNPVEELVKIQSKHLVPKWLLKDLPEKYLSIFDEVITEVVSFIGVDINTASVDHLKRVAGLDEAKAKRIVKWRQTSGPFFNRQDLLKVKGIDNKTFEQCAGFIQIMPETIANNDGQISSQHSTNQLDQTQIHPESYDIATALLDAAKCNINQLGSRSFIFALKLFADQDHAILAERFGTTKDTIELIVKALTKEKTSIIKDKGDVNVNTITSTVVNPRIEPSIEITSPVVNPESKPSFEIKPTVITNSRRIRSKSNFDNLVIGMVLVGVVRDIKPYGAFVNVGIGKPGLIRNRFMNGITLTVGQRVETTVNEIDKERCHFSLQLVKCK